jgi:hypothetical protein
LIHIHEERKATRGRGRHPEEYRTIEMGKTTPRSMEVRERGEKGQIYRYAATKFIYIIKKRT